jgi:hypothetical protein
VALTQYLKTLEWETELTRKDMPTPRAQIRLKAFKGTLRDLHSPSPSVALPKGQDFSRTRLHNRPGLTDKRRSKIRLPHVDTHCIKTKPVATVIVKDESADCDHIWAKTQSNPDFIFGKKKDAIAATFPSKL